MHAALSCEIMELEGMLLLENDSIPLLLGSRIHDACPMVHIFLLFPPLSAKVSLPRLTVHNFSGFNSVPIGSFPPCM